MRYVKDFGEVHENASNAYVELAKEELSVKLIPVPHYSAHNATVWGFSARVYRNEGGDDWGYAEGYDPDKVILEAVEDYRERIKFKQGRDG